jgi:hypothetical protein
VATGGKLLPTGVLDLGRKPSSVVPQRFAFETLPPSMLAENAAEAAARAHARVPAPVGPPGPGSGLVVLPVARVTEHGFSPVTQEVVIGAEDADGTAFEIRQRYLSRAAGGIDALLSALDGPERLCWVAGTAEAGAELELRPTGLVFEAEDGARRMVQPSVDPAVPGRDPSDGGQQSPNGGVTRDPIRELIAELQSALGDSLGLRTRFVMG